MKKLNFVVRPATSKDLAVLADFRYKLDMAEYSFTPHSKPTRADVSEATAKYLRSRKYFFYIAEVNGKPVGFSEASIKLHERTKKFVGMLDAIWVEPRYRKQGIAKALSEVRIKKLKQFKPEKITVYIRPENKASIKNIEGLGGKHIQNVYTLPTKNE